MLVAPVTPATVVGWQTPRLHMPPPHECPQAPQLSDDVAMLAVQLASGAASGAWVSAGESVVLPVSAPASVMVMWSAAASPWLASGAASLPESAFTQTPA